MLRFLLLVSLALCATAAPTIFKYRRQLVPMLDGRIVGGNDTTIEEYPWQISMTNFGSHRCGGSIVTPTKTVTAAHCVRGVMIPYVGVRAGSSLRTTGGVHILVNRIIEHENYNVPIYFDSDIALMYKAANVPHNKGSKLKQHQSNRLESLLEEHGGLKALLAGRIVGGNETTIENVPWIVSVRVLGSHNCGGSIISKSRVLTAAHCTAGYSASYIGIRAGSTNHGSGGHTRTISRNVYHPYYSQSTLKNDIAIFHFTDPLNTDLPSISAVALPERDSSAAVGSLSQVSGWGATCESCGISATLRYVMIPIISNAECSIAYDGSITDGMLCAAYPEGSKDACQGDSGGPLTYDDVLEGIVSWGQGCARPNFPGVYTRVAYYRDWIDEN